VSARTATNAPRIATPPMTSGDSAAIKPRKISTSSTKSTGSEKISARVMSSSVCVLACSPKATTPPTSVSRPAARRSGAISSYAAILLSAPPSYSCTAAYVARRSLLINAGVRAST
jgi:hypothetical protein